MSYPFNGYRIEQLESLTTGNSLAAFYSLHRQSAKSPGRRNLPARARPAELSFLLKCSYSTVTLFAKFRGWSTSHPRAIAIWYDKSCNGMTARIGVSASGE